MFNVYIQPFSYDRPLNRDYDTFLHFFVEKLNLPGIISFMGGLAFFG